MDRNSEERLSALLDAELSDTEGRHSLPLLIRDDAARETFNRYRLIGDIIRSGTDASPPLNLDFAKAISSRIDLEPTVFAPASRKPQLTPRWIRAASGMAIAASVAMLAIYWAPQYLSSGGVEQPAPLAVAAVQPAPAIGEELRLEVDNPELQRKLNRYLVSHGEYASGNGMNQMLPYASFVSYDAGR